MSHISATPSAYGDGIVSVAVRDGDGRATARRVHSAIRSSRQSRRITAEFNRLHLGLLAADEEGRDAVQRAIDALIRPELCSQLREWWRPCADREDTIVMGVDDALLKYFLNPMSYVPGRGDAVAWFVKIARNKMLDLYRRQTRAGERGARRVTIEQAEAETLQAVEPDAESRETRNAELLAWLLPAAHTDAERRYLRLKFSGASVRDQAAALGAGELSVSEQHEAVNRGWSRIKRRAERQGLIERQRRRAR